MDSPKTNIGIEELTFSLFQRSVHPELFKIYAKRRIRTDKYHADIWITGCSHVLSVCSAGVCLSEVVSVPGQMLPEPDSEQAKDMRQKLIDKKNERKKILLSAWDDAIKRQATDRSLEILRDLDQYLTPNEGIALQEAARDVFRTKLHNLGVRFSLAVSNKDWSTALITGRQIITEFPNSKMAGEIREKIEILKDKV